MLFKHSARRFTVAIGLALPIVAMSVSAALADRRDFNVHNQSGVAIHSLQVSESGDNNWGSDILGRDVLPSGESALVYFNDNSNTCLYDIKAIGENGEELDQRQVDLCKVTDIAITN